ncbi:MAG TPA: response regulator [Opitutaceae bacterium]|nr:response regulator [Opitutaceae bacterium]
MPTPAPVPRPVVLLVDDEAALLDSLRVSLEAEFDLDLASSAEEAELMMATRTYDVVVSDHLMPGEEGLQFLIRAQQRRPATQRILLTGYMNPELISRSVALAGLSSCLVKPVRAADLAVAIHAALR